MRKEFSVGKINKQKVMTDTGLPQGKNHKKITNLLIKIKSFSYQCNSLAIKMSKKLIENKNC